MNKNTDGMFCTGVSGSGALPWVVVGEELGVVLDFRCRAEERNEGWEEARTDSPPIPRLVRMSVA